jgi:putative endonuclease
MASGWVYILTNRPNGTLYAGVTDNLARRAWEHREGLVSGFATRYGLKRVVYYEHHADIRDARQREALPKSVESSPHPVDEPRLERPI